ncbi:PREDICTED: Bardet-Biedl syndrome 4 protein homolog isoform X2 [Drosophila arizonae]|uniref:Bardet-Biedl syndrome 4 protein homolog isoform X2 n=1 Tax=Drosophila arizonae TaxID=7263 RepID=A0ABM1PF37_DROAR|nr:PREDICTED: Bardet-Biedl syndrome 4 protein homolog isoform X2 [Drosophila arizonae]
MYEAGSEQINCNGALIELPSLQVVKPAPKMPTDANIDWLLHIYFTRRQFERCRRLIARELNRHLNAEYLYFPQGLIDREAGNNIEALRNLQRAAELNSKNIENFKEIGRTLYLMGRYNQALSVFRDAEQQSPRPDHEIFHYLGELLYRSAATQPQLEAARQQQKEAREYFERAVQTGKKQESYIRLAELYRKEKEYQKAIDVLEACLHLTPENVEVLTEISVLYLKINETQRAFDRLAEIVNFAGNCEPKGLLALGAILQSRNDVDGALSKYSQIADAEPEIAELWNNIGLCFFKKQKFIVAISSLRKSIWLSPLNYNALYNLSLIYIALCLRKLDDMENAFVALERACSLASGNMRHPLVFLNFALFCFETGRLALATEHYNRFMSHAQDLLLPTEYKFQATKLKSLLRISTHSQGILGDGDDSMRAGDADAANRDVLQDELPLEVNAVVSTGN